MTIFHGLLFCLRRQTLLLIQERTDYAVVLDKKIEFQYFVACGEPQIVEVDFQCCSMESSVVNVKSRTHILAMP